METIRQKLGSKDCLACVAAMATNTTVAEYKDFYRENKLPFDDDLTFLRYIHSKGFLAGVFLGVGDGVHSKNVFDMVKDVDLSQGPAYVVVESDSEFVRRQGASHAVYYDGEKIHDPGRDMAKSSCEYKVICIMPIVKNASHLRWKGPPDTKATKPPELPPPAATPQEIAQKAAGVGETEGRRLRKKTGRRATRIASPGVGMVPATVARAGLKTKLGATV